MKLKMNYKVAELPHLFFNRALPEGARVSARSIAAALVFIDRQPAGPFDCREQDIKIGAFQLYGRDHADGVTVGCHYFTAEAVNHIRAQLARGDQAAAAA